MLNEKTPKNAEKFECVSCDFKCSKQSDYTRHLMTRKHINAKNAKNITPNAKKKCQIDFNCSCGKRFKHQSSYSRHKKTCTYVFEPEPEPEPEVKEKTLVTQEKTTEDKLLEYIEKQGKVMEKLTEKLEDVNGQTKVINNYNTTNNFNLNMFLNDTCKNAMNITDFMESIKLTLADMDHLGKVGYVDAVSKVIVDGLNQLDVSERPIHCTDAKRNSLYLKNNDEWNKEAPDMPNIKKVIKNVTNKNQSKIYDWMDNNPSHKSLGTAKHREYMSIVGEAMGPTTDEEETTKFKSIINRVSSATVIDKQAPPQTKSDVKDTRIQVTEIK